MTDSPAQYAAKVDAMIAKAKHQINDTAREYVLTLAWQAIDTTPGPNLQLPETEYIAVGRLRGGWYASSVKVEIASRYEGGPYTEHGDDTLAAIAAFLGDGPLPPMVYLNNDVAYGYIVWHGIGRMPFPRPWTKTVASPNNQELAARKARLEAMGR